MLQHISPLTPKPINVAAENNEKKSGFRNYYNVTRGILRGV